MSVNDNSQKHRASSYPSSSTFTAKPSNETEQLGAIGLGNKWGYFGSDPIEEDMFDPASMATIPHQQVQLLDYLFYSDRSSLL